MEIVIENDPPVHLYDALRTLSNEMSFATINFGNELGFLTQCQRLQYFLGSNFQCLSWDDCGKCFQQQENEEHGIMDG